jgi:hypothetical protein
VQVLGLGIISEHDVLQEETLRPFVGPLLRGILSPLIVMLRARWFRYRVSFVSSPVVQTRLEKLNAANPVPPIDGKKERDQKKKSAFSKTFEKVQIAIRLSSKLMLS